MIRYVDRQMLRNANLLGDAEGSNGGWFRRSRIFYIHIYHLICDSV